MSHSAAVALSLSPFCGLIEMLSALIFAVYVCQNTVLKLPAEFFVAACIISH